MSKYIRKTQDEFQIWQHTSEGWEEVCAESSWKGAKACKKEYLENQPEYSIKIKKVRVKIEEI